MRGRVEASVVEREKWLKKERKRGEAGGEDRDVTKRKEGISALSGNLEVYTMRQVRAIDHSGT